MTKCAFPSCKHEASEDSVYCYDCEDALWECEMERAKEAGEVIEE